MAKMPRFKQLANILNMMDRKESIRNVGVIAHIDHGKTTMTDSLLIKAGMLPPQIAGSARALDYLEEEQRRGITIKTANISLLHEMAGKAYIINLVDTPGHVDFTGKVARALRAIDGAIVVVDAVEEIMAQTETVTRQALEERVKPVLFINKVDRLVRDMQLSEEEIQKKFLRIINDFNNLIEIFGEPEFKEKWKVDPAKESVAFGSALHKWGFTTATARKEGIKFSEIAKACTENKHQTLAKQIPLHDAILDMTVKNTPSPVEAQQYRVPKIWKGVAESEIGQAMMKCVDDGPTTMCITMIQMDPRAGLIATGRLFSGTVEDGKPVYLVGARKEHNIQQVSMYMGASREKVNMITAGNVAALTGLESAITGETLVDVTFRDVMVPFERVKYVSEPVLTMAVEPENPKDLPILVDAMKRLSVEDPNLVATISKETGEYLLSGIGELHLEIATNFLKEYTGGIDIATSEPMVQYSESIAEKGAQVMARSANKQNSFWIQVEPVEKAEFGGNKKNVWAVDERENILVDRTEKVEHLSEAKDAIVAGFRWACRTGPLCEQPLRNLKVKIMDAEIHEDPPQRESAQIMRAVSRAILGSFLTAKPVLLEPIYKIEATASTQSIGQCTNIITRKRGKIFSSEQRGALAIIKGYIPVAESFGLSAEMRSATSGRAFWQFFFDHWEKVPEQIASDIIRQIRKKRGLPPEIPKPDKFADEI